MIKAFIAWLMECESYGDIQRQLDAAYCAGVRKEREEILAILDRLIPQFVQVNNSVARQAREEIAHRGCDVKTDC